MARLIKGEYLTPEQRRLVLSAFIHRDTIESPWTDDARRVGGRTVERVSDNVWIRQHAFWFNNNGLNLDGRHDHCEPSYMADE